MKRTGLLLFSSLALLLLSSPAGAQPELPGSGGPAGIAQSGKKKTKTPPVKDENGEEIDLPDYDDKTMQCVLKCQEPTGKCMNACEPGNHKCTSKCAQGMERCTKKCGVK